MSATLASVEMARKLGAGGAGVIIGAAALWGSVGVFLLGAIAAQHPDPTVPDGDPCCGHPDTWGEVAAGSAWTTAAAVFDGLLFALAVALIHRAAKERWPRPRTLVLLPIVLAIAAMAAIGIALAAAA